MEMPQGGGVGGGGVGGGGEDHHQGSSSSPSPPPLTPPMSPESAAAAAAAAIANARWTPTKEQIAVLEGLYNQGLRTPTAEQIQQVTARLREYGHIEGKNVFYWFQNHKARQRQKEKQKNFAYFSKILRRPPPLPVLHMRPTHPFPAPLVPLHRPMPPAPPPPPPASACNREVMYQSPCYMTSTPQAAANAAYYRQRQLPVMYQRQRMEMASDKVTAQAPAAMYPQAAPNDARAQLRAMHFPPASGGGAADVRTPRETLQLFPLQPTFMLPDKTRRSESASATPMPPASASASYSPECYEGPNGEVVPFYDFFGVNSGGRS